jgi:hypothetical protein
VVCDPSIGPCLQPSQPSDSSSSAAPSSLWTTPRTTTSFSLAHPRKTLSCSASREPRNWKTALWSACFRASTPHFILILGGNSTFGTQAAVEYVRREDSVKELLQRLKVAKLTELTPFEGLLHVKIADGVPVMTDLVSVRNRSNQARFWICLRWPRSTHSKNSGDWFRKELDLPTHSVSRTVE